MWYCGLGLLVCASPLCYHGVSGKRLGVFSAATRAAVTGHDEPVEHKVKVKMAKARKAA